MAYDENVERLQAVCRAIGEQQQAATRLAEALAQLAMETEQLTEQSNVPDMVATVLHHKDVNARLQVDMDMNLPGTPSPRHTFRLSTAWTKARRSAQAVNAVSPMPSVTVANPRKRSTFVQQQHQIRDVADAAMDRKASSKPALFADPDELREQIREKLVEEPYDVCKLYKETGIFQAIIRNPFFEMASMALVIISSIWMAIEMDFNDSLTLHEAEPVFQIVAHLLCFLFLAECIIRVMAFQKLRDAIKDRWTLFDIVLVVFFISETWILGTAAAVSKSALGSNSFKFVVVFRVLRILRVLRLARVLQHVPELMVIVRGLGRAFRAILVVLALLGIIIYVGAIIFTAALRDTALGEARFSTVTASMGTLMLDCTLTGSRGTSLMREAWDEHPIHSVMMLLFVLVANVTMLGVLTGLLVQTVKTVAEVEKEEKSVRQLVQTMDELWSLMLSVDDDNNGTIDMGEFLELLSVKQTSDILRTLDVDVDGLANVSAFVFEQNGHRLGRREFLQMVLDLRNSNKATVKDHIETRKFLVHAMLQQSNEADGEV